MNAKVIPFGKPQVPKLALGEVIAKSHRHICQLQAEILPVLFWELRKHQVLPSFRVARDVEAAALVAIWIMSDLLPAIEGPLRKAVADYALFARECDYELE